MKKLSHLAVMSLVLASIGAWCAWVRPGERPMLGIMVGLGAVLLGAMALASIRRRPSSTRGRGLAGFGMALGALSAMVSMAALLAQFIQQISTAPRNRQSWEERRHGWDLPNRMPAETAAPFTSNLPIVVLDTAGQFISRETRTVVRARFYSADKGRASLENEPVYDGAATINLRGNTTLQLPKKSYTLHTIDQDGSQIKVPLLGLPAEEDWVLYAPFEDKSLIRDVLAYDLARRIGQYAPRTRYVELFLRESDRPISMRDYAGVYVLVEKIKRGKDRVNIAKLEPDDQAEPEITGGYIIKRDHGGEGSRFRTRQGGPYTYVYPKAARITAQQKRWLSAYFNAFESALYGPDFADPRDGYAAFLDVDSFIDAHWLIEMSKNVDGFRYSAFITKDRGAKLKLGPPWDWNRSFGNANYYGGGQPHGWYYHNLRPNEISWHVRLREDPEYARRCASRWRELRRSVFDPKNIHTRIDELAAQLDEAQERNFRRWPVLGRQITCNHYIGRSFEDEVRWLKKWITRRIEWIDNKVSDPGNL
jgi:hypothetical protein